MARFAAGGVTSAGSTTLPLFSLYGSATVNPFIYEIQMWNTTSTAVQLRLVRLSTVGTRGTAWTAGSLATDDPQVAGASATSTHTAAPTIAADLGYRCILGAAVGSGVIWTFGERFLRVGAATTNGIGVVVEGAGAGQALSVAIAWSE